MMGIKYLTGRQNLEDMGLMPLTWREKWVVYLGMLAVALSAWFYLLYMAYAMQHMDVIEMWMAPHEGGREWTTHDFWMLFSMWTVMMIAMMTPSVLPMISIFQTVNKTRRQRGQTAVSSYVFYSGYLIAWAGFSLVITLLQWPLHTYGVLTPMMESRSTGFSGLILMAAGLYQWTPLKDVCLHHCRTPLSFVMTQWRDGVSGALVMGMRHGWYCVGCCWGLMILMFVLGVMNVLWMLVITVFVLLEKTVPANIRIYRLVTGLALLLWGGYLFFCKLGTD